MTSIGYIRQSRRADLDVALSYDAQLVAIRKLAAGAPVEILKDMGRSGGRGKEYLRAGYQELLHRIEAGECSAVFALNLTRVARSVPELYRFMALAKEHAVRIVTVKEGVLDPTTATGKLTFGVYALLAEFVRDLAVESAAENIAVRRARGDRMGRLPYGDKPGEDPARVLAAYLEGKSLAQAARILNAAAVPSSLGRQWSRSAVSHVLTRRYPDAMPERTPVGRRERPPFALFHLVRCSCKTLLTGSRQRWRVGSPWAVIYRCHRAEQSEHPSPQMVPEARVLDFVKAEMERLAAPEIVEMAASAEEAERLQAERVHVLYQHQHEWINDAEAAAAMVEIETRADALRATEAARAVPEIDWTWSPADLNRIIASVLVEIRMDEHMQPVEAIWRNPALRRPD